MLAYGISLVWAVDQADHALLARTLSSMGQHAGTMYATRGSSWFHEPHDHTMVVLIAYGSILGPPDACADALSADRL